MNHICFSYHTVFRLLGKRKTTKFVVQITALEEQESWIYLFSKLFEKKKIHIDTLTLKSQQYKISNMINKR